MPWGGAAAFRDAARRATRPTWMSGLQSLRIRSGLRGRRCSFVAAPLARASVLSHAGLREQPRNEAAPEALSVYRIGSPGSRYGRGRPTRPTWMSRLQCRRIRSGLRVRRCSFVAAPLAQANVLPAEQPTCISHAGLREQPRNEAAPEALSVLSRIGSPAGLEYRLRGWLTRPAAGCLGGGRLVGCGTSSTFARGCRRRSARRGARAVVSHTGPR